jgi:hypothetical protein
MTLTTGEDYTMADYVEPDESYGGAHGRPSTGASIRYGAGISWLQGYVELRTGLCVREGDLRHVCGAILS